MFDVFYAGVKPNLFEFEQPADNIDDAAAKCRTGFFWFIYGGNDYANFDFSWKPVPWESSHVHVWASQWQKDGWVYLAHSDTAKNREWHFRTEQKVTRLQPSELADCWYCPPNIDVASFDWSWHPDIHEPAYEYHFPTQWQSAGGPVWRGTAGVKLVSDIVATALPNKSNWTVPEEVNENTIDFSWHPNPLDPPFVYHFGSDYQQSIGLTYTVPDATEIKFAGLMPSDGYHKLSVMEVLDIFYIDKGNPTAQVRFERLSERFAMTKVRYANSLIDTIKRCANRSKTNKFWVISSEYDYDSFDFRWHAAPWQQFMTHVFPSQHQKWGDTFLINKWEFNRNIEWAKSLEEFPNLNFVSDQVVNKVESNCNMYYVDHGNPESHLQYDMLKNEFPDIIKTRAANDYLDVMKRIMATADTEYVWILNSICNYDFFDFTWQPEPWQKEMIHCFSNGNVTNEEMRGDTFYIHVESFKAQMIELELLDWFNVINYVETHRVERWLVPVVHYEGDDLTNTIKNHNFTTAYALFTKDTLIKGGSTNNICLWTEKDRIVRPYTKSHSSSLVPRDVKKYLKTQMYDYPYLENDSGALRNYRVEEPLDIVYISNGEPDAERWYEYLEDQVYSVNANIVPNDIHRVQNVNGRVAAYQAAALASTTPWFFAVFAKLEVAHDFKWGWQPDYWQAPKHYIFNAKNPINGLEYGHMGMIAYNKQLVLQNNAPGIDFTLSQPHESVPILSGTAHYNQDAWTTWRTAFREVLKLRLFMDTQPTLETEHRLNVWLTVGEGQYAGMSILGAQDAVAYYEEVNGVYFELMKSFEWDWLRTRFNDKNL